MRFGIGDTLGSLWGDVWRDLWRSFVRDRLRTLLTLSGIFLGAASIVFLASALSAAGIALARTSQSETGDDLSHAHGHGSGRRSDAQTYRELGPRDVRGIVQSEGLSPRAAAGGNFVTHQEASRHGKQLWVSVQAGDPAWAELGGFQILHGRMLDNVADNTRGTVIGYEVWEKLFDGQWPLEDARLVLNGTLTLQVTGVMQKRPPIEGGGGGDGSWLHDRRLWVTNDTFFRGFAPPGPYEEILVKHPLVDGALPNLKVIGARLTEYVQTLHLGARNFEFQALNQGFQLWQLVTYVLGAILFGSGLVAMVVGAVNVMNSQLMTLGERTKEFGVRRALGESALGLCARVAVEAAVLSFSGGVLGAASGLVFAWLLSLVLSALLTEWPFLVVTWSLVAALGLSALAGIGAGLLPALRARALSPSEALRAD